MNKLNDMYKRNKKKRNLQKNKYTDVHRNIKPEDALNYFLEDEFQDFKEDIMKKSKKEIFDTSYEITAKEEIKDTIKNMNLHRAEKEMLILQENILDEIYQDWLKDDTPLGLSMQDSIEQSIDILTKHIRKKYNLSRKKDGER